MQCINGHPLGPFRAPNHNLKCTLCKGSLRSKELFYRCGLCKYEECSSCAASVLKSTIGLEMQKLREQEASLQKAVAPQKKHKTPLASLKAIKKFTSLNNINAGGLPPAKSIAGQLSDKLTTPLAVRRKRKQMNRVKKMYDVGSVRRKMIQVKSIYEYLEREGPKAHKTVLQQLHEVDTSVQKLYELALRQKYAKQTTDPAREPVNRSLSLRSLPILSRKSFRAQRGVHSAEKLERQSKSFVHRRQRY